MLWLSSWNRNHPGKDNHCFTQNMSKQVWSPDRIWHEKRLSVAHNRWLWSHFRPAGSEGHVSSLLTPLLPPIRPTPRGGTCQASRTCRNEHMDFPKTYVNLLSSWLRYLGGLVHSTRWKSKLFHYCNKAFPVRTLFYLPSLLSLNGTNIHISAVFLEIPGGFKPVLSIPKWPLLPTASLCTWLTLKNRSPSPHRNDHFSNTAQSPAYHICAAALFV